MPLYPFFLTVFAVLSLYSENMTEIFIGSTVRLLVVLNLVTAILLILIYGVTKDWQKSGLLLGFLLLLFYTYGHVHTFKDVTVDGVNIFRHKYLIIVWSLLGVAVILLIRRIKDYKPFTVFTNTMSVVMLFFPAFNIGRFLIDANAYGSAVEVNTASPFELSNPQPAPDVYFIVMDAYGRADVLKDLFGFDNSEFIHELESMGFYVVECSQSNYAQTQLSIASTLNMDYVQNLVPDPSADEVKYWISPFLLHSQVRNIFEGLGYKTIAFYNDYPRSYWLDADYFLQPDKQSFLALQTEFKLTSFEELFLNTTMFSPIIDLQLGGTQVSSDPSRREADQYLLDTLPNIPQILGPKFVYAHLLLPHPPFIFGPNGEEVKIGDMGFNDGTRYQNEINRKGYRDQTIYTNNRLVLILAEIIENSPNPPIIVLESDHGPTAYGGFQNRMGNFMAYYFPDKDAASLAYPSITPVNTFRLVFNTYFGGEYPLLNDVSYYSDATYNFDYEIVPNTCTQK